MNSLLYYYNNVQKMAAYRQAKRMQRGALTAQGGFSTTDPALLQTPFTIQCVIRPTKVTSTLQVAFNTKGNSTNPRIDLNKSGDIVIYGGGSILYWITSMILYLWPRILSYRYLWMELLLQVYHIQIQYLFII